MENVGGVISLAEAISDYGISIMMNAIFLTVILFVLGWFKKLINKTLDANTTQMSELIETTRAQTVLLDDIAGGLRPRTLMQIRDIYNIYFSYAVEQMCLIVKRMRKENHLADKKATSEKVKLLLDNIHNERNAHFENHTYRGRTLKDYTNDEWRDWAYTAVMKEIYRKTDNEDSLRSNIKALYNKIKYDFDERLNK